MMFFKRNEEYVDDSDDEIDGYVEMDEIEDEQGAHAGANIEIGAAEMDSLSSHVHYHFVMLI